MCSERLLERTETHLWQNTLSISVCPSKLAALSVHDGGFFFPPTRAEGHMTDSTTAYPRTWQKLTPRFSEHRSVTGTGLACSGGAGGYEGGGEGRKHC